MTENNASTEPGQAQPKWRPIPALDRRILGVLVEKAKTTPDQYPMTLNGLCSGCNQKNNRFPQMEVQPEDVEEAIERLRAVGAIAEIQGSGRVNKYRHFMYEWLGVEKLELAVMAELLLRGAQTEGELRGRAARMDPIADLGLLRSLLDSLRKKGLIASLSAEGRGHVLTHALYEPREMEKLRAEHRAPASAPAPAGPPSRAETVSRPSSTPSYSPPPSSPPPAPSAAPSELLALRSEVKSLHEQVAELRSQVEQFAASAQQTAEELQSIKDSLGV